MPFVIGLTGSIGMGKSTTAKLFAEHGIPTWDADQAVRRLYAAGGAAVAPLAELNSETVVDGAVSKDRLKEWIARDSSALRRIEKVVHPLVAADRRAFLDDTDAPIVLVDIPLLFEAGYRDDMDLVVVASAPADLQRERVLARPGMTEEMFERILAKQMPDAEKRARADAIVECISMDTARRQVDAIVALIQTRLNNA